MAPDGRLLSGVSVLAAVVETGNFARAGESLGLTPSAISRAVARLEARLGVRLFERTPRTVTLTEEGRRFHAQVAPLLSELADAADNVAGASLAVRGRVRVNVDPWLARLVLAPRLEAFMARYPELSLELVVRDTLGDLVGQGYDAAVRFGEPEPSGLIAEKLLETRIITCAAPSYLAQHGTPRHPSDLVHHACLMFRDPTAGLPFPFWFQRGSETMAVKVRERLILNDLATKLAATIAGYGVAQSVAFGLEPYLKSGALAQVLSEWSDERYPLYAYHASRRHVPARVRAFLDFVKECLALPRIGQAQSGIDHTRDFPTSLG
jgi:DNA-binding transcriptional LysR family regulator